MPALERLRGIRVVADPVALDAARWSGDRTSTGAPVGDVTVLRFAPDEAFAIGARHVDLDDSDAIVAEERGFVGARIPLRDAEVIERHLEWSLPDHDQLAQGNLAGVPVKITWSMDREDVLLVVHAAHAHELARRLGWSI